MNRLYLIHGVRALILVAVQGLLLQSAQMEGVPWQYFSILIYPLVIILLPVRVPTTIALLVGFLVGLLIDLFYHSPGVHAGALVATAFCRPLILGFLEPRGGYATDAAPDRSRLGLAWLMRYSAILLAAHLFFYFSLEAFSFYFIGTIFLNTVCSFVVSYLVILLYVLIMNNRVS